MKKILVFTTTILFFITSCKKSVDEKVDFKNEFYEGCMRSIKNSAGTSYNFDLSKEYCNCVIENVLPKLSDEEIQQISQPENQTVQNKINTLVDPCLQDYLNKSQSLE